MIRVGYVILTLWLGLTFLLLDSLPTPRAWRDWPPDLCRRTNCYCEPIRDRLIAQPAAAYSNFGLVLIGLFILRSTFRTQARPGNLMLSRRAYPLVYGLSLLCLGLFSFFYHASLTKIGDYLDLVGMYLFTSYLMVYNLNRLRPLSGPTFTAAYLAVNAILALGLVLAYGLQQVYFAALVTVALAAELWLYRTRRVRAQLRYLGAALACFGIGGVVWLADSNGLLPCNPAAPITWHALWHLAVAASAVLLFFYYRSEESSGNALPA
jgi:hypothetical protein